jgi:two-component system, NtrC family, sensor kinase
MRLRLTLQRRILLSIAGGMAIILLLSAYLHQVITRTLIEDVRYNTAISRTVAISARIAALQLFDNPRALQRDIQLVVQAPEDFQQIDVFQRAGEGLRLTASTAPSAARLPALNDKTADNELREMEHPLPEVVTMEVLRGGVRYWLISSAFREPTGTGYVTALVRKSSLTPIVGVVQFRHNLVLGGVAAVCAVLFYVLFEHFFRRPARAIVQALARARTGDFTSRADVRRDDELGEIAGGFNVMMEVLNARDREREALLARIGSFNDELRAEVARATGEVREANEALLRSQQQLARSERLAALGHIAGSIAHEIGTPLNSISGHIGLLARRLPDDPDAHRRVVIINQQLDSIVASVRHLLQRTRKPRSRPGPADLNALIGEWLRLVAPVLDGRAIAVTTALETGLPPVVADPDGLRQVFLNLVNNSVDAMPAGGRLEIVTRTAHSGGFVEMTVQDSGPGLSSDAMDHLFEPLWTTKPTGTGFGLSIAREILAEQGGTIDVDPAGPGGARFRLRLPLAEVTHGA